MRRLLSALWDWIAWSITARMLESLNAAKVGFEIYEDETIGEVYYETEHYVLSERGLTNTQTGYFVEYQEV